MKRLWIITLLVTSFQFLNCCASNSTNDSGDLDEKKNKTDKVVIGYIPTWKDMRNTIDNTDLDILTHINISFLNPDDSGAFLYHGEPICSDGLTADINYVVKKAHENSVKVLISVAGGILPDCSGNWNILLQEPTRGTVVNNLKALAEHFNLDGIDIDIEGALLTSIDNAGNYTPFIQELRNVLNPLGKLVTCATASYVGGMIPKSSIPFFDYINIMAYDNHWNSSKNHSTYNDAISDMQLWRNLGCPSNKLVLGVPFYAYAETVGSGSASYKDIVTQNPNAAQVDIFGAYKYNGIPTMQAKTEYAMAHGAGIMIWEISQDATGNLSLLQAIGKKL
tara:strand:- start:5303 stop:6310 length:1008 start_codon:yes stop_codon:yes gene_type:complete